uniref:Ig-like domain-containing protein n=1 Tax=Seriola lalandi dorsalis TaxID=1841481 RepID=A0A3B4YTU8_SERLL
NFHIIKSQLTFIRCTDEQIFESKTVCVGDDVTLTCARKGSGSLFWIRTVSGKVPQVLGKTYSLEPVDPRIEATEERETFVLSIKKAKLSDTAVYYCMKIHQQKLIFLNGTDLRVEGKHIPTSDPVHTEASGCLQCSTLSDSETKLCPEEKCVCCFGAGAESQPSFNYTQGNSVCGYDKNPEGLSTKKCICTFLKNVTSSDNGTYYCAVATCEQIISGNGSKLHSDGNCIIFLHNEQISISVCLMMVLNDKLLLITLLLTSNFHLLPFSCYVSRKRDTKTAEEESIYTDVRALGLDK